MTDVEESTAPSKRDAAPALCHVAKDLHVGHNALKVWTKVEPDLPLSSRQSKTPAVTDFGHRQWKQSSRARRSLTATARWWVAQQGVEDATNTCLQSSLRNRISDQQLRPQLTVFLAFYGYSCGSRMNETCMTRAAQRCFHARPRPPFPLAAASAPRLHHNYHGHATNHHMQFQM